MSRNKSPAAIYDSMHFLHEQQPPLCNAINIVADFNFVRKFLLQYAGVKATFESYRRELERLSQWSWRIKNKSLLLLDREDIEEFIGFCQSPPLAWIGLKRVSRFVENNGQRIANKDWRLFVAKQAKSQHKAGAAVDKATFTLAQSSLAAIFASLGSFYSYLLSINEVSQNPILQIKQKSKYFRRQQKQRQIRRLSELQWDFVIETAELMAQEEPAIHERTLFVMSILYLLYLRISELTATSRWEPQMGHFYLDSSGNWWFKTVGKGNKERDISVPDSMLIILKRYRSSRGLSPALPQPNETTALIHSLKTNHAISSDRQIRFIVQACFDKAAERMRADGFNDEADRLELATVHWLRHTGISDDINKHDRPIAHVRDDAGHSSSAITDKYNDVELQSRHASARKKLVK